MSDVRTWLAEIGLGQYADAFEANDVEMDLLNGVDDQMLKDIGVTSAGLWLRIRNAIAKLARASDIQSNSNRAVATPDVAAASGERRQLTVMFCDLVGSTALSEKLDPEELRGLLHAYRTLCGDVIVRYDGFVARYVGDEILTYFGWPNAHEEDAERAMRAALEIVHTVRRASSTEALSVRIGIATGPVVVGEMAGKGDQSKLAVGSTPNLAARLQGLAVADQIVVAASTRRLVGSAFELTDLGEHDLKGIAEPVHAWRVECALATESRFDANRGGSDLTRWSAAGRNWICCSAVGRLLGTVLLSVLSGHRRYAHITALRCDPVNPPLLGMRKVLSEDSVRRGLAKIDEAKGLPWLQNHLDYWVLRVDVLPGDEYNVANATDGLWTLLDHLGPVLPRSGRTTSFGNTPP
jgi:class 3 adenylate cyclase